MAPQGWGPGCQSKSPLCPSRSHCCRTSNRNFVQALTLHCIIFSNQVVFVHLVGRSTRLPLLYSELSKVLAAQWLSLLPPVSHSFRWKLYASGNLKQQLTVPRSPPAPLKTAFASFSLWSFNRLQKSPDMSLQRSRISIKWSDHNESDAHQHKHWASIFLSSGPKPSRILQWCFDFLLGGLVCVSVWSESADPGGGHSEQIVQTDTNGYPSISNISLFYHTGCFLFNMLLCFMIKWCMGTIWYAKAFFLPDINHSMNLQPYYETNSRFSIWFG